MTGLKSFPHDVFYRGHTIIVLDAQQRLQHSFAVIFKGYHTFRTIGAAQRFIRGLQ